jgi:magnesium chelatase family protein
MSLAVLKSRALAGMEAQEVSVEVHLANGLPAFTIVGLADTEVKEARTASGPPSRTAALNFLPSASPSTSHRPTCPRNPGALIADRTGHPRRLQIPSRRLHQYEFAGELSLSGELRPIRGALAMSLATRRNGGCLAFILPLATADEAALVSSAAIYPAHCCCRCAATLPASRSRPCCRATKRRRWRPRPSTRLADVKGQVLVKRGLEVAAAGNHSVLLVGPPGSGKTMLASRFVGLLPEMSDEEALEAAAVIADRQLSHRAVEAPAVSRTTTPPPAALVGGGCEK